jgi:hypothetical protein
MRAITNASEANRSGLVYAGNTELNQLWGNASAVLNTDLNNVVSGLPVCTRSPSKQLEVYWLPGPLDTHFWADDQNTSITGGSGGRSTVTIAFSGAPPTTGYVIECTGVYEVVYPFASGIVTAVGAPPSRTSWNVVLRSLLQYMNNSPVVIDGMRKAIDYVSAAGQSYLGTAASRVAVGMLTM